MIKGFRLEGQIGKERTSRTIKPIWEYTAGDILDKNANWMTDKSANAEMMTRSGDAFDFSLKSRKKIMTIAIPERYMRLGPLTLKQYIEMFMIRWYSSDSKSAEDYWRLLIFHHVTVTRIALRDFSRAGAIDGSYYEVVMKIDADIEYLDKFGSKAQ